MPLSTQLARLPSQLFAQHSHLCRHSETAANTDDDDTRTMSMIQSPVSPNYSQHIRETCTDCSLQCTRWGSCSSRSYWRKTLTRNQM
jgi:hypothetical protein